MASQNDGTHLVKRKRTKRQRSSSPFLVANMTSSSSTTGDVDGIDRGVITAADYNSMSSSSAPTTSSGGETYESTEEEEDMANCLIMLAQGGKIGNSSSIRKTVTEKISSRRFSTVVTSDTNRAGFYVYECKTCYRTFPSFQALGGHRASHKKPKSGVDENKSVTVLPPKEDCAGQEPQFLFSSNNNNKGGKIHECSICGSEFTSGQALGGHMRRHRATGAAVGNNPVVVAATTVESNNSTGGDDEVKPRRNILPLDLNLPAPEEDHPLPPPPPPPHHHHQHHDSGFQFGSTQQPLVFSAPTLVDCHY